MVARRTRSTRIASIPSSGSTARTSTAAGRAGGSRSPRSGSRTSRRQGTRRHVLREAIVDGEGPRTVTCFGAIEHLETFVPLVELLTGLARDHDATAIVSVPNNDAFWAIENPYHQTI